MRYFALSGLAVVAVLAITPSTAFGQEYEATTQDILNNIWVFLAGVLVFFMQAGFALVEAGLTRAKNVVNIFAKNIADAVVGVLAFFACGYAFAYGGDGTIIGDSAFFLSGGDAFGIAEEGALSLSTDFFLSKHRVSPTLTNPLSIDNMVPLCALHVHQSQARSPACPPVSTSPP